MGMYDLQPQKLTLPQKPKARWPMASALCLLILVGFLLVRWQLASAEAALEAAASLTVERYPYFTVSAEVREGTTYGILMEELGVGGTNAANIFAAAEGVYDLSNVRLGRTIELTYFRDTDVLHKLSYQIDSEEILEVYRRNGGWIAERVEIPYEIRIRTVAGIIESSLYLAGLEADIDERAIIALADVFQWEIDFVLDVRTGDSFKFIFEERYLDGRYVMPGRVLAAKYVNEGATHYAFLFEDDEGRGRYYDEEGGSVERVFLKTPAQFKYISSGFTTGLRYITAFDT